MVKFGAVRLERGEEIATELITVSQLDIDSKRKREAVGRRFGGIDKRKREAVGRRFGGKEIFGGGAMASAVKAVENQTKHLTKQERQAKLDAQESVMPSRENGPDLKPPKGVTGAAATYWNQILKRCEDVLLIDDLDREMLAVYCQQLVRRNKLNTLYQKLLNQALKADPEDLNAECTDKLDGLFKQIAALERNLMAYADKLGFTPQSRVRLAQKRAAAAAANDPEGDFFGD